LIACRREGIRRCLRWLNGYTVNNQVTILQTAVATNSTYAISFTDTQFVSSQLRNRYVQSLTGIGANLEGGFERTVQQFTAVEVGFVSGTGNFRYQLFHFRLQRFTVYVGVSGVGRLYRQFADTLQVVVHGTQCAFGGLGQSNTVTGVTYGYVKTFDLRDETGRNRHTCGVVFGAVNTQTRRQTL